MEIVKTAISGVIKVMCRRFDDARGYFSETYNKDAFEKAGFPYNFVQDNRAYSVERGVVRGLHYQTAPRAQGKLVSVLRGAILDVAVDIRRDSSTFGNHVAVQLNADELVHLYVPVGFAHGYVTLEPHTEVFYKVTDFYSPEDERGILWDDPDLKIEWPISPKEAIVSEKDRMLPVFSAITDLF